MSMSISMQTYELLARVRQQKPLVHHLTNWVTIYDCAQILKSIGASPVMAHAPEEAADMARLGSALVLNIGTLTIEFVEAMKLATAAANAKSIPVVLDACGVGATRLRDDKALELLAGGGINIIKGNASEIGRLGGLAIQTKGVDATEVKGDLAAVAQKLARERGATVVITGKEDVVADAFRIYRVGNGHELMTSVVGTGCMAASVIGAFAAVEPNLALASACALAAYGVAAEVAAKRAAGPASFKVALFDAFHALDAKTLETRTRITG